MASGEVSLRLYDVGLFGALSARANPAGYVVVMAPQFELLLPHLEKKAGRRLTPEEIDRERAKAPSIVLTREEAARFIEAQRATPQAQ